jgi:ketosteroid isomerase-like protein
VSATEANRALAARLYAAEEAGDFDGVLACFSSDCVFRVPSNHPVPGPWTGLDRIVAAFGEWMPMIAPTGMSLLELIADGDERVIALAEARGERADGTPWSMPAAEFLTVRDGKIVEVSVFYWDLVELRRLAGVAERRSPGTI